MKLIVAMIPPERLDAVRAALENTEATMASVSETLDLKDESPGVYRGGSYRAARVKMRLEVLVANDMLVEETARVVATACTGDSVPFGKGSIFVLPVDDSMPIRGVEPRFAIVSTTANG